MNKTEIINFNELKPGDYIIGSDNKPTRVEKVYETHIPKDMYEIIMEDGTRVKCSGTHLWYVETDEDRANEESYWSDFVAYVSNYDIPEFTSSNAHYPIETFQELFAVDEFSARMIERICISMGHSGETPEAFFDGFDYIGEHMLKLYSVNSFNAFVHKQINGGYFYCGRVINANELYKLLENGYNIHIPKRKDVENGRR